MSQITYIRDELYKVLIRREVNIQDFVNDAIREKLEREGKKNGED